MALRDFLKRDSRGGDAAGSGKGAGSAGGGGEDPVVGHAVDMIKLIEDALKGEEEVFEVPCNALLPFLPEEFRGEQWQGNMVPDVKLQVAKEDLLKQLKRGRLQFPLIDMASSLPAGWVTDDAPDVMVDLDLAEVVRALPPEVFELSSSMSMTLAAIDHSRTYFSKVDPAAVVPNDAPEERAADDGLAAEEPVAEEPVTEEPAAEEPELTEAEAAEAARIAEAERKWREIMDAELKAREERMRKQAEEEQKREEA